VNRKTKKYLIATETREVCVIRGGFGNTAALCAGCGCEVEFMTLDCAVRLSRIRALEIFRMASEGAIHWIETESGHLLLCPNSLIQLRERGL
jgi:hypothetical protein